MADSACVVDVIMALEWEARVGEGCTLQELSDGAGGVSIRALRSAVTVLYVALIYIKPSLPFL